MSHDIAKLGDIAEDGEREEIELAIRNNDEAAVSALLKGKDAIVTNDAFLLLAMECGSNNALRALLKFRCNTYPNIDELKTPPKKVRKLKRVGCVNSLKKSRTNTKQRCNCNTILHVAASKGLTDAAEIILKNNAQIVNVKNHQGETALLLAVKENHVNTVKKLLEAGADPNIPANNKETPLLRAMSNKNLELMQTLISNRADPNYKTPKNETLLHMASTSEDSDAIRLLLAAGANQNVHNNSGLTPLHLATGLSLRLLVEAKDADLNVRTKFGGDTCLNKAVARGNYKDVKLLINHCADVNVPNRNELTPLYIATRDGKIDLVKSLLEVGANPNWRKDEYQDTPLHVASERGHEKIVSLLLESGADPSLKRKQGKCGYYPKTPLAIARIHRHPGVVKILKERGVTH